MPSDRSNFGRKEEQTAKPSSKSQKVLVFVIRKCSVGGQVLERRRVLSYPSYAPSNWTCRAGFGDCLRHVPCNESFEEAETAT